MNMAGKTGAHQSEDGENIYKIYTVLNNAGHLTTLNNALEQAKAS